MKFSVGYQLSEPGEESFVGVCREFKGHIAEVYFPWLDMPTGRAPLAATHGADAVDVQEQLEGDLAAFRGMGFRLSLLFNASCYGPDAFSRTFANEVRAIIERLNETVGLDTVTTMSPMIALAVKERFPNIRVRASVNMRLGSVQAMRYVSHLFDSFTMQREFNRDLDRVTACRHADETEAYCAEVLDRVLVNTAEDG